MSGKSQSKSKTGGSRTVRTRKSSQTQKMQMSGTDQTLSVKSKSKALGTNSRFQPLNNTCKYCGNPCGDFNDEQAVQCCTCKEWTHKNCESQDNVIITELQHSRTFLCSDCKEVCEVDPEVEVGSDSSMESDSKYGENDEIPQTQGTEQVQVNESVNGQVNERTPVNEHAQINDNQQNGTVQMKRIDPADNSQNPGSSARGGNRMASSALHSGNVPNQRQNVAKPEKVSHENPVEVKLDQMMNIMTQVQQDINRIDTKTKIIDAKNENFLRATTSKLKEQLTKHMDDTIARRDRNVRQTLGAELDDKISQGISRQLDQTVDNRINHSLSRDVDKKIDEKVKAVKQSLEETVTYNFTQGLRVRVEGLIQEEIDEKLDEFQDKLWRTRNLIFVNVPESSSRTIPDRQADDLHEAIAILNQIVKFHPSQMEGVPVRVGKVGNRPRLLRITLKSDIQVGQIVKKARENNDLLNPEETDNSKKIYINRDYSEKDRTLRKKLFAEKREREQKGETDLVIRRNKVVKLEGRALRSNNVPRSHMGPPRSVKDRENNFSTAQNAQNSNVGDRDCNLPPRMDRDCDRRSENSGNFGGRSPFWRDLQQNSMGPHIDQEMHHDDDRDSRANRSRQPSSTVTHENQHIEGAVGGFDPEDNDRHDRVSRSYEYYDRDTPRGRGGQRYYTPQVNNDSRPNYRQNRPRRQDERSYSRDRNRFSSRDRNQNRFNDRDQFRPRDRDLKNSRGRDQNDSRRRDQDRREAVENDGFGLFD